MILVRQLRFTPTARGLWDFEGRSYRIARGSVQGTADMQIATATGTFMRIVDNSSYESDAAISIAREMYEMAEGADMSRKDVLGALKALHGTRNTAARGKKCAASPRDTSESFASSLMDFSSSEHPFC